MTRTNLDFVRGADAISSRSVLPESRSITRKQDASSSP